MSFKGLKKLLIGGSPCTYWSIAQTKNRETEASGMGWELFKNYLIARDKFKPDYFLYENNKSMSRAIREQITHEFGFEPVLINSALVSAQNRNRLYWVGKRNEDGTYSKVDIEQPKDRGILLRDILETGVAWNEKAYTLTASYNGAVAWNTIERSQRSMVAEPVRIGTIDKPIYEVLNGIITINGKRYPIKLADGYYIIRKLTVRECMRLQTVPEWYEFLVSNSQAYKMLGNGWTVEVIKHIMSHMDLSGEVDVLSMYDGMNCGQIALNDLSVNIANYYAMEIDKYAIQTTQHNFPNTIQLGDAFQVREGDFGQFM